MSPCLQPEVHVVRRPRRWRALAVTVVTVVATIVVPGLIEPAGAASRGVYPGIDVSAHQHPGDQPIDWRAVRRSGVRFAFIKATEGAGRAGTVSTNSWFAQDWKAAGAAGVVRGAYHYARPRYPLSTAASDAQRFSSVVRQTGSRGELAPVLDLEETGGLNPQALASWVDTWLRTTSKLFGRTAMIYTTRGFWTSYVADTTRFSRYPLWMANHTTAAQPVPLPGGWKAWSFWQYSATGRVAGINDVVDLNWSCGWPGSTPSGARGSICTTTTSASAVAAGATVQAPTAKAKSATSSKATTGKATTGKATTGKATTSKATTSKSTTSKSTTRPSTNRSAPATAVVTVAPAPPPAPPRSHRVLFE